MLQVLEFSGIEPVVVTGVISLAAGYMTGRLRRCQCENQGEAAVRKLLTRTFNDPAYHLLNDLTFPVKNGTVQVDHIFLSRFGVFVIETRHHTAWAFCQQLMGRFTRYMAPRRQESRSDSMSQCADVGFVREILHFIPPEHIHSLVVMTGDIVESARLPAGVCHLAELKQKLDGFADEIMSEDRLQFCIGRLEFYRFYISSVTDIEHQHRLNRKFGDPLR